MQRPRTSCGVAALPRARIGGDAAAISASEAMTVKSAKDTSVQCAWKGVYIVA